MKAVENPEFILIQKIQALKEKYENIPEIAQLEEETREIIKQNCITSVQMAAFYFMNCGKNIDSKTEERIGNILQNILDSRT